MMEIQEFIPAIKRLLGALKARIRETMSLPYAKLYLLLALVMTAVFTVFIFPYEIVVRDGIRKIEPMIGRSVHVGTIDVGVIGSSHIDIVDITLKNGGGLTFKDCTIDISTNPVTLFMKKRIRGTLSAQSLTYRHNELDIQNALSADFDIRLDADGLPSSGFLNINIDNMNVKGANIKGFSIPTVRITSIKGEGRIENGTLSVRSLKFLGNDLRGEAAGSVEIKKFVKAGRINITIGIDPESMVLEEYKMLLSSLTGDDKSTIRLVLSGTVGNPRVNLPGAPASQADDE